jgi:hypothetical protein
VLPNSGTVTCGKVLNVPQVNNVSTKSKKLIAQQSFAETKAVLAGELAMARYHSQTSGGGQQVSCQECEEQSNEITNDFLECQIKENADAKDDLKDDCNDSTFTAEVGGSVGTSGTVSASIAVTPVSSAECRTNVKEALKLGLDNCDISKQLAIRGLPRGCDYKE